MAIHNLKRRRSALAFILCLAGPYLVLSPPLQANEVQVGRYSLYAATPTLAQDDLLAATLIVRFPERIQTLGEAVRYLLQRSGYRLAATESTAPETLALFALPLPAAHRHLGPMTLREALETLAGPAFHLVQDPVHRLITFEQCAVKQVSAHETMNMANVEVAQDDD